ncbi:MAG: alpha/beta fold hydrolase [Candidatus Synoicihabitans palmerolidicus]|nr:alpha/beta fold hydrolase [Candidatus Synoicihabitans palmerolidicus]
MLVVGVVVVVASCATSARTWEERYAGMARPESWTVTHGDREVRVMVTGRVDGPLVLFVHGTLGSWGNFSSFLADPALANKARVVAMDRPGWGESGYMNLQTDLGDQAAAVAVVLRRFPENRPAIVVGHSLGGTIVARAVFGLSGVGGRSGGGFGVGGSGDREVHVVSDGGAVEDDQVGGAGAVGCGE